MENKNQKLLESFTAYCKANPNLRFWQALRSWAEVSRVMIEDKGMVIDTFYFEDKLK